MWEGTDNLNSESDLFTVIGSGHYEEPEGFCFEPWCLFGGDPIQDDPDLEEYNVDEKVENEISK